MNGKVENIILDNLCMDDPDDPANISIKLSAFEEICLAAILPNAYHISKSYNSQKYPLQSTDPKKDE